MASTYLGSAPREAEIVARMQWATRAQGTQTDSSTGATVALAERYYRTQMYLKLAAQVVFFAGVALVVAAGITWYQQAQQPEPAEEADDETGELAHASNEE